MDKSQPQDIIVQDNHFYQQMAVSFAATRQNPWAGWQRLDFEGVGSIVDIAGGNGRFYHYAQSQGFRGHDLDVDASDKLLGLSGLEATQCQKLDVLAAYQQGGSWREWLKVSQADLVVCFGFFHHVPTFEWRQKLLQDLWMCVAPGGRLAVSFWQFLPEKKNLVVKDLGGNDYWLSWGGDQRARRFAHYWTDAEIDQLAQKLLSDNHARIEADYRADGRSGQLNRYLVWRRLLKSEPTQNP